MNARSDKYQDKSSEHLMHDYGIQEEIAQVVFAESIEETSYSKKTGPLFLNEVDEVEIALERDRSLNFDEIVQSLGWPTASDKPITAAPEFASDEEFLAALVAPGDASPDKRLNNFLVLMRQVPSYEPRRQPFIQAYYSSVPILHRFHALLPDFADALQRLVDDIETRHANDKEGRDAELSLGVNGQLVSGLHIAYTILGRLITPEDGRIQARLLSDDLEKDVSHVSDTTDAWLTITR